MIRTQQYAHIWRKRRMVGGVNAMSQKLREPVEY